MIYPVAVLQPLLPLKKSQKIIFFCAELLEVLRFKINTDPFVRLLAVDHDAMNVLIAD